MSIYGRRVNKIDGERADGSLEDEALLASAIVRDLKDRLRVL